MAPPAELIVIEHDGQVLLSSNVTPGFFVSGRDKNEAAGRFVPFLRRTGAMPMAETRASAAPAPAADPSRPRALYIGFPFDANWGDRWMYQVLERRLPVRFIHPRTLEEHWHKAAPRGHYDLALLGGGTLINQKPQFFQEVAAALAAGLPVAAFGTGVGEPERWGDHRAEWGQLLRQFRFLGVRGPLSARTLAEAGITNHVVTGDSCLLEQRPALPPARAGSGPLSLWLDLSFGAHETRESLLFRYELLALLGRLERERRIALTLFTTWPVYLPWIEEQAAVALGQRRPVLSIDENTRDRLAEADVGLVYRLHAAAGLLHFAVPTLAVSYESKCRDFLAHLGLEDLVVTADPTGVGRLRDVLEGDLEGWRRQTRERVAAAVNQGHARAEQHLGDFVAAVTPRAVTMRRLATIAPPGTFLGTAGSVGTGIVVGRVVANAEFWRALARWGSFDRLRFFAGEGGDVAALEAQLVDTGIVPRARLEVQNLVTLPGALAAGELDVLHLSAVSSAFADLVWLRDRHAPRPVPVTAQIHSLSYPRFLGDYLRALLHPPGAGDAIFCSSAAGRAAVRACFDSAAAALAPLGAQVPAPSVALPVVPLGVDPDRLTGGDRARTRKRLGLPDDACVVLGMGRFTEYDKMDLFPLLQAFRGASERLTGPPAAKPYLLLAGARQGTKTPEMVQLFARLLGIADRLRLEIDFPDSEKANLLAAADVFVSPSDNLQETFGLSVVEAMAAGLPVVVSDLDGYKDTVDEQVGIRVPARFAAPLDEVSALSGLLYERPLHLFLGQAVEIDLPALETALAQLCGDAALRTQLGQRGAARVRERYDWKVVIAGYEAAWQACAEVPLRGPPAGTRPPLAMDFQQIFASFPTGTVPGDRLVARTPLADKLARGRNQYLIYPELRNLFDNEDVLALLALAHQPVTLTALAEADARARPALPAWRRAHALAWLLKHGLLG